MQSNCPSTSLIRVTCRMSDTICRWGFLSAADIARKNWHSVALSGNGQVVAVASRSAQKAEQFIADCQQSVPVPHKVEAVEGYEALLARDDIDAVYIPLPTGLRTEWVLKAANSGKHVMVEKPCGVTAADVQAMIDACNANNVQFMDGVMFMHSARLPEMRRQLDDADKIGPLRYMSSQFTFNADDDFYDSNIRGSGGLEPAGCLGDLGWYTIRLTLWVMKYEMPVEVRGRLLAGVDRQDGLGQVPTEFQGEMYFASGVSATFFNSFRCQNSQEVVVNGRNGYLHIDDYVLPFYNNELFFDVANHDFVSDVCRFNMENHTRRFGVREYSNNVHGAQEVNLFRCFSDLVNSGRIDPHWPDIALKTQRVLDAALESSQHNGQPMML